MSIGNKILSIILAEVLLCTPIAVSAAETSPSPSPTPTGAQVCAAPPEFDGASNEAELLDGKEIDPPLDDALPEEGSPSDDSAPLTEGTTSRTFAAEPADDEPDPGEGEELPYQSVDLEELKANPFFDQAEFDKFVSINHGWEDKETGLWNFCTLMGMDGVNSVVPVVSSMFNYLEKLEFPYDQIEFQNPLDLYALTGEVCRQPDPTTGYCDETKAEKPVLDINGQPILDENGVALTELAPVHYDDTVWPNGKWDAPKADLRLLKTLVYLVTPKERGGAGRERIKVGKILQPNKKNMEMANGTAALTAPLATPTPSSSSDGGLTGGLGGGLGDIGGLTGSGSTETPGSGGGATTLPSTSPTAQATATPEPISEDSAHAYDLTNPSNPSQIATAMDIVEIDNVRITTRIVQKRRVGGNTTTYKYKSVPLKVAWQTDQGVQSAELVGPNMYQAALSSFTLDLAGILDNFDLEAELDLTTIGDLNSFADVAMLIGQSLVTQLLNSPSGSLNGWDLESVLESLGRAYLAQQLGLPSNALSEGTTVDELIQSLGRVTVERAFGLPQDSLTGDTSVEIFASLGRRQIESALTVKSGTLLPYGELSQSALLERIGAGRIEERLRLPAGSMRTGSWSEARNTAKTKFLFTSQSAYFLDESLGLTYQNVDGQSTSAYGFSASDFADATSKLIEENSDAAFAKYKRMVGARAIESGIGRFASGTSTFADANTRPQVQNFVKTVTNTFGFQMSQIKSDVTDQDEVLLWEGYLLAPGGGNWYIGIKKEAAVRKSGGYSDPELAELGKEALTATLTTQFGLPCESVFPNCIAPPGYRTESEARELYNKITSFWRPTLQSALTKVEESLGRIENRKLDANPAPYREARDVISVALGQTKSYAEGLLTQMQADGQSGRSAALNLPGTFVETNADGTLTGIDIYSGDPINNFLAGNVSRELMSLIGRAYAAQATTNDPSAQQVIISETQESLDNFDTLKDFGIDVQSWVGKGFNADDFDRIFTKNLGPQVFKRVGEQQLLATLWGKANIGAVIQNATGGEQVDQLLRDAGKIAQGLAFYTSRFKQLQSIGKTIESQLSSIQNLSPEVTSLLRALNGTGDLTSIGQVQDTARQYEPVFKIIGDASASLKTSIEQAQFILREIAAGHALTFNQAASGNPIPKQGTANDGCFNVTDARSFFQKGGNLVKTFTSQVAGCRVDDALGLPIGSAYAWYLTKDYSFDSLALTIGKRYAESTGRTLSDDAARAYGKQLLGGAALTKLVAAAPGVGSFLKQLGFKGEDIVNMLNGRGDLMLAKLGGTLMDNYFNWKLGTGSQIVSPTCRDDEGKVEPCTRAEATSIRLATIAQVGLQKLGITLNFPSSLNLFPTEAELAGMDFRTNFGIARISETFGLRQNSFYGNFTSVLSRNEPRNLLQGLGWYDTPAARNLYRLTEALNALKAGKNIDQVNNINDVIATVKAWALNIYGEQITELQKADSGLWSDSAASAGAAAAFSAAVIRLFNTETDFYNQAIGQTRERLGRTDLDAVTANEVSRIISNYANPNLGTADEYGIAVSSFKRRLAGLDGQYGQPEGTFKGFILGTVLAQDIAARQGQRELVNTLASSSLDKLLAGTPFEDLPDVFKVLTKTDSCPTGATIADYFVDASGQTPGACTIKSVSLRDIATGTSIEAQAKRAYLYDHFLARSWGMELEKNLKLQPGTLRAIAIKPWAAKEIAVDQGIRLLGAQILKLTGEESLSTDPSKQVIRAVHTALMAGFCPVDPLSIKGEIERELVASSDDNMLCTTRFDAFRSVVVLRQELDSILQNRFNQRGTDSLQISLVDLAPIFIGGLEGAYYLGAAQLAMQVNKELGDDAGAAKFKINYNDIRNAFGSFMFTAEDYQVFVDAARADFARSYYNCYVVAADDPICSLNDTDIANFYINDPTTTLSQEEKALTLEYVGVGAEVQAPALMKKRALENLQYNLYDIAAYKIDPNIPRGFAYTMLKGSNPQKLLMLESYLVNKLNLGETVFGGMLTDAQVTGLLAYVQSGFKGAVDLTALGALDNWLVSKSNELLGIQLPAGTVQSIFAWGTTGFKGNMFDTSTKLKVGTAEFLSVGTLLKNWGISKLLTWADTNLGWQAGSAAQIYQAAADVVKASNYLKLARSPVVYETIDSAGNVSSTLGQVNAGDISPGADVASPDKAAQNLKAAQATLAATIINIVFASEIAAAEQSLGLVPGTGALAVTMLVQLAMGVPVDPITLGLFIGMNLIGVYDTEVSVRATVDGYYPYTGEYGEARIKPVEYISPDPQSETFNAMDPLTYRAGLKHGAQYKVNQLLQDLLLMPERWSAGTGEPGENVFVEQVFTARPEDISSLDSLLSRPAPWQTPSGWGYGSFEDRAVVTFDKDLGGFVAKPKSGQYAGFFAHTAFGSQIHVRF